MFEMSRDLRRQVRDLTARLAGLDEAEIGRMTDRERLDLIRDLEVLKCAAEAGQGEAAADIGRDVGGSECSDRSAAGQVALARRESPHRGRRHLGLARILRTELPCTRAAFKAGRITEWRATVIARETACLSVEDRRTVDRAIAGDPDALESYSDRILLGELTKLVARLDPAAVAARRRRAESERRVTTRPAPDTMGYLTALLPVAQLVACYAALMREAETLVAAGDPRSRGQIMADTLVARITGTADTASDGSPVVPVSLGLVMSDKALFGGAHDSAHLAGFGPIPAGLARQLVADHLDTGTRLWLRRLYTDPESGQLVAMDSRQRCFRGQLAEFIGLRDQFCRNTWCGAPIRHRDHVTPAAQGGDTSADDGQGLCENCNYLKEEPGWTVRPRPGPPGRAHTVEITTPANYTYPSTAPPLLDLRAGAYRQVADGLWTRIA